MNLTPKQIVAQLDRYIVGQAEAKKAVAIAIRNRWRRTQLPEEMRQEISPKNIIMMGPTGVGKTEIARRLATLVRAPFLKVEATKYTEVGYHGRDVESIVRDLTEIAVTMVKTEHMHAVEPKAKEAAEDRLLDSLLPRPTPDFRTATPAGFAPSGASASASATGPEASSEADASDSFERTREKLRKKLRSGELDERVVELDVPEKQMQLLEIFSNSGIEQMGIDMQNMLGNRATGRTKERKMKVSEARALLQQQEAEKLLDQERVHREAIERVENAGLVFIDEIDKIAFQGSKSGPDVSREGVQRDLLPIVEGSTVVTRYGMVNTSHILFIAAGAFHMAKVSDLIPELQGRFPIRVELSDLGSEEFRRILSEPHNALTKQYSALIGTEGVTLDFESSGIDEIASIAQEVNRRSQNIGARRLQTVMERMLEEVAFEGADGPKRVTIDREYVRTKLADVIEDEDLARYIL